MDNFFQFSHKSHLSHADRNKNFTNSENQRIKLNIFANFFKKRDFFYTLRKQSFFFISFCSFEGVRYFLVKLFIFFSKLPSATNQ